MKESVTEIFLAVGKWEVPTVCFRLLICLAFGVWALFFFSCAAQSVPDTIDLGSILSPVPPGQVQWRSWAHRDSARILGRPILIFLYTRRSFWCRELIQRCFEDEGLAREVVRGTFPIRVDADRRPDLADRFGMGGVPSLVFLTPEERWITGSTYMDREDLQRLLRRVRIFFDVPERMADLERERGHLERRIARGARRHPRPPLPPSSDLLQRGIDSVCVAISRGERPAPEALLLLLEAGPADKIGEAAFEVLDRLIRSPQRDRDGTFWGAPLTPDAVLVDREKHLALNASLLNVLSAAARLTGRPDYQDAALSLGTGLLKRFYSPGDTLFFAGWAAWGTRTGAPGGGRWSSAETVLRDPAVYTGWNALAVSGLVSLYQTVGDARFLETGIRVLDTLQNRLLRPDGLFAHGIHMSQDTPAFLEDQALIARAALDAWEVGHHPRALQLARDLADRIIKRFGDDSGALRDSVPEPDKAGMPVVDRWLPSANGVSAQVLVRLAHLTGQAHYREEAFQVLTASIGPSVDRLTYMGALTRALLLYLEGSGPGTEG